ncbi:hypothetical protein Ciccas_003307 [Cichlidogyrus casuarinus]|uniref:BHLH domain-containing protein n=1 Tax=Cichlidogyrus casuarinus TaxID=1844966 RepID=A0ABD2QER4_9PLAT
MSQNRYSRTHSYSTSDTYGYANDYPSNIADEDDIELDDDEFLSDGFDDDMMHGSSHRNSSEYDSSQYIRRAHHNRLEQKRRAFIRDSYTDLKDVMPEFKGKKLSRANILINVRKKVEDNRKALNDLKRLYESKKGENDREEREVMNLERQLSAVDNNGNYLVDMHHSTPPLANIGINLISGVIHRPIVNRSAQVSQNRHLAQQQSFNGNSSSSYSNENSPENTSRSDQHANNLHSTGNTSNADTPSICSLTDSPINSGSSSLSSINPPTLTAVTHGVDQVDGKSPVETIVKCSPSLSTASHLMPLLEASPPKLSKAVKEDDDTEASKVPRKQAPPLRPTGLPMTTRRMRSCSMSVSKLEEVETEKMGLKPNSCKRSFVVTGSQCSTLQTKKICVTAVGGGNAQVVLSPLPIKKPAPTASKDDAS